MLLWKGKGTAPAISPDGAWVGYERGGGVILENVVRHEEIFRHPQGMDPQWWDEESFAFRVGGQTIFQIYDLREGLVQKMHAAPGAVFLCKNRHWCSWEKKSGRLWVDGMVAAGNTLRPLDLSDNGEPLMEKVPPPWGTDDQEFREAVSYSWAKIEGGILILALELPQKKLKVFVESVPHGE